jgi:hypothetical protein
MHGWLYGFAIQVKMPTLDEEENETYVLGIQQYLRSDVWVQQVKSFLEKNAALFLDSPPFTSEHHALFQSFQKLADEALESVSEP